MPQTAWVSSSWSWSQSGDKMPAWPTVEQPQPRWRRSAAMVRRTLDQYVAVCPSLQLTSHTQPTSTLLRTKCCERYIFIKKCVCLFIEVRHYIWLCFHLYLYMYMYMCSCMWLYNITPQQRMQLVHSRLHHHQHRLSLKLLNWNLYKWNLPT